MLEQYVEDMDGHFLDLMARLAKGKDKKATSHRWLIESTPKRMVFAIMYGDLLASRRSRSILDIGGGYSSLTRLLNAKHEYWLVDLQENGRDWNSMKPNVMRCDIAISNDLFPNVDQRLDMFISRFLPYCKEMRLSLTYFNKPHWYTLKRTDGDEIMTMLAWTGKQTREVLEKYNSTKVDLRALEHDGKSIFPNGRQVAVAVLKGTA